MFDLFPVRLKHELRAIAWGVTREALLFGDLGQMRRSWFSRMLPSSSMARLTSNLREQLCFFEVEAFRGI